MRVLQKFSPCTNQTADVPSPTVCRATTAQTLEIHRQLPPDGVKMKTILLMTAVLVLAGCGERQNTTSGADTTGMAPVTTDTAAMMHSDTTMMRDTAQ